MLSKKLILLFIVSTSIVLFSCSSDSDDNPIPSATTFTDGEVTLNGKKYSTVTIVDRGKGIGTKTLTKDKIYLLSGFVFVNSGQILTIEEGTIIKGKEGQGENASALIVARGGKIKAEGSSSAPIIFTSEADNIAPGQIKSTLAVNKKGLWGGVVILGNAKLNSTPGTTQIEGMPTDEKRGNYGGTNNEDNSGSLKYVSIRFGGTDIGAGNEINGLTLGGVGSGTSISYIEVFGNKDDGVEFFGGTVNTSYIVVVNCGDDSFDYDEGYRGENQFWVTVQDSESDRAGEHDGGTDPETAQPYATPIVANATYIGAGQKASGRILTFRDNAGGKYYNSMFVNFKKGIEIEILKDGENSFKRLQSLDLELKSNYMGSIAGIVGDASKDFIKVITDEGKKDNEGNIVKRNKNAATPEQLTSANSLLFPLVYKGNSKEINFFRGKDDASNLSKEEILELIYRFDKSIDANLSVHNYSSNFIKSVTHIGAFNPLEKNFWTKGWTNAASWNVSILNTPEVSTTK